jgi:uncharacterized MAPEG superfamily protein
MGFVLRDYPGQRGPARRVLFPDQAKEEAMTPELTSLTWVAALSAIMWIPYVVNALVVRGIADAVGYPKDPKPLAPWAQRMKAAHYNSVENLVVFASLVLVAHAAGISNATTVLVCQVYFWARVVHLVAYTLGIPWVRTFAFAAGWICCVALIVELV